MVKKKNGITSPGHYKLKIKYYC